MRCAMLCCAVPCCSVQSVRSVSASPTDQMFASGSDDNTVKVWDLSSASATTLAGEFWGRQGGGKLISKG